MKIYFGIDCAPGSIRPNVYAEKVFKKLGVEPIEAYSKLFGAWEWEVTASEDFDYEDFKKWMKMEMDRLYEMGHIRGAQWDKVEDNSLKCTFLGKFSTHQTTIVV